MPRSRGRMTPRTARMAESKVPRIAHVVGSGTCAASAAMALVRFGWRVRMSPLRRSAGHVVALNGQARFILDRLWGPGLLARTQRHNLTRRIILWGEPATHQI